MKKPGDAIAMTVEWWPISRPKPYEKNARKWSKTAVEKVAASIKSFGWRQPIVCDAEDVIIIGHLRLESAKYLGLTRVPVHVASELTPEQVKALRLADNRLHEESDWMTDLLAAELDALKGLDFDLTLTGFSSREISRLLDTPNAAEDELPEIPVAAVSRPGDVWHLGPHRAVCGDATDRLAVSKVLGDARPVLLLTDPPYGIELDSKWRERAGLNGGDGHQRTAAHTQTAISGDARAEWSAAFELVPSLEVAYVFHASVFTREVLGGLERIGFLYPQQIIWDKTIGTLTRTHYWYRHEPCWYMRKKNAPWFGKSGENLTVWVVPSPKGSRGDAEEKLDHPTQKPVELMRRPILNHTEEGGLVYDPFLGSGTTLAAAELTGRVCYGIELDPKFVDVIVLRWEKLTGRKAVLDGISGQTFEKVKAGRRQQAEDELMEEALEAVDGH